MLDKECKKLFSSFKQLIFEMFKMSIKPTEPIIFVSFKLIFIENHWPGNGAT